MNGVHVPKASRWFWLLPFLAMTAWWPLAPYWQSDDFFAVQYAQDFQHVLHDFTGPQYSLTELWLFYRPLITASFWLDQQLGGVWPPLSHCSNVLAHAISTLLLALVWRRFLPAASAFFAALLWALMPGHSGSIAWAVGRVDSHTTVWCLLTILLVLRRQEHAPSSHQRAWPCAIATAAALASKELALVLPLLATIAVFGRTAPAPLAQRVRAALALTWPVWLVWLVYLPFRVLVLGRLGGYDAAAYDVGSMVRGLATVLTNELVPLHWVGLPSATALPSWVWLAAGALPALLAIGLAAFWRRHLVLLTLLAFGVALAPVANFLAAADNPQTLRYYYLPAAALVGIVAAGGRWGCIALLLAWAWPFVAMRQDTYRADTESAAMHQTLLRAANEQPPTPMFVAGLPHANASGNVVQLHFGIDRLLAPPFTDHFVELYALRPLANSPAAFRLFDGDAAFPLPRGSTWFFSQANRLSKALPGPVLPELPIRGDANGSFDLTTPRLDALLHKPPPRYTLHTPGVRQPCYRLTLFTANGYLTTLFENHAAVGATDGEFDATTWFSAQGTLQIGRIAAADTYIGDALLIPVTIDVVPEFPALLEAGTVTATFQFVPSHRAQRLLTFRFDRDYPDWVRRAQGR